MRLGGAGNFESFAAACAGLLAVYAVASVASVMEGDDSLRVACYAATACIIVFLSRTAAHV